MSQRIQAIRAPLPWYRNAGKLVMASASTGAAIVSIVSFLYSYGVVGESESHKTIGTLGVAWVGVRPQVDTAWAIGDTLHLAATVTDRNGAVLIGVRPTWSTEHPEVATALADGSVIARGAGRTTITVTAGDVVARAHVLVRQRAAMLAIGAPAADSVVTVAEGGRVTLQARVLDARGHEIAGHPVSWQVDDSTVAVVDSLGTVRGELPGRAFVVAAAGPTTARLPLMIVAAPAALATVSGAAQRAVAGAALPQPVVLRATSRRGQPVDGAVVRFRLTDGRGRVSPDSVLTDADGRARATWTLAPVPGRQAMLASVDGVDSVTTLVAEAEPTAAATRVSALAEIPPARASDTLAEPVGVRVTDTTGRPLVDVAVQWTALDGGAVRAAEARTDSVGAARARWALGPRAGRQRLRVQVGSPHLSDVRPVELVTRALAGPPAVLAAVSGDAQRGVAGRALARPVVVRLLDARGNGIADAPVSLTPAAGGVADSVLRTDSTGTVRVAWTLGRVAGAQQLSARTAGLARPLRLTATARPGAAANLSFDDAPGGSATRGARRLVLLVADEHGNPVPDARVQLSAPAGRVAPARAVSDAAGRVKLQWTPGAAGGEQRVTARVIGADARGVHVATVPAAKAAPPKSPAAKAASRAAAKPPVRRRRAATGG